MSPHHPQDTLAVILLPSGDTGIACREIIHDWAEEGLLQRAVWVLPEDVQPSMYGGASVQGQMIEEGSREQGDVLLYLARSRLRTLTLATVQIIDPDAPIDHAQLEASRLLIRCIKLARPVTLDTTGGGHHVLDLLTFNLVAGPTGIADLPSTSLLDGNDFLAHVLASPEDRRAADQMDRFVVPGRNLDTWSLAQAVSLLGIWSGLDEQPWLALARLGDADHSATMQERYVVPMRAFVRVITSAPTARRALAHAMNEVRFETGNTLVSDNIHLMADPSDVLTRTLDSFDALDAGRLQYQTPTPASPVRKRRTPLMRAVGEFLSFSGREIVAVPGYFVSRSTASAAAKATQLLSGEEGHQEVSVAGVAPDVAHYLEVFERQADDARTQLATIEAGVTPGAPELWRTLRQTVFGLLDGSPLPDTVPVPTVGEKRVVVPATSLVVPTPTPWRPQGQLADLVEVPIDREALIVPPCSPTQAAAAAAHLTAVLGAMEAARTNTPAKGAPPPVHAESTLRSDEAVPSAPGSPVDVSTAEPETVVSGASETDAAVRTEGRKRARPGTRSSTNVAAGATAAKGTAQPRAKSPRRVGKRQRPITSPVVEARALVTTNLHDLERWIRTRQHSLLWRLAERVSQRTAQAGHDRRASFKEATTVPQIDIDELRRARNQFSLRFLIWLPVTVLVLLLTAAIYLASSNALPGQALWLMWTIVGTVLAVWLLAILLAHHRRRSRFLAQLQLLQHAQLDARRRCAASARAEALLGGMYEQLQQWAEILGYSVHDPWSPKPEWLSGRPSHELVAELPACVDLAYPDPADETGGAALQRAATLAIAGEGWRSRAFSVLLDTALGDRTHQLSAAGTALIDQDAPAAPNGSRATMLEKLRSGELQQRAAVGVIRSKAEALYAERATLTGHLVIPAEGELAAEDTDLLAVTGAPSTLHPQWGNFLGGVVAGETEFAFSLWSPTGSMRNDLRGSMTTLTWTPPGMDVTPIGARAHHFEARPADRNRGVEVALRLDVGPPVQPRDLRAFSPATAAAGSHVPAIPTAYPPPAGSPQQHGVDIAWQRSAADFN